MIKKDKYYKFEIATNKWLVPITQGMLFPKLSSVFNLEKMPLGDKPEAVYMEDDNLVVSFGGQEHTGYALVEWGEEGTTDDSQVVQDGYGNNVTITVTQNGGGAPSGSTF